MRVLVCHSGRQHSHQLAMALAERGMLVKYITGIPTRRGAGGWLGQRLLRRAAEAGAIPIDPGLVKHVYIASLLRKAAAKALSPSLASTAAHFAEGLFDRYVCRFLSDMRPDAVVAYENSALATFRRAKQLGITTILDAASVHHLWQDRFLPPRESERSHRQITRRKDEEIKLADQVLVVSAFARESYLEAGVPSDRVHTVPVGVDTGRFQPVARGGTGEHGVERDLRFVYVGNSLRLKGLDILRGAVSCLHTAGQRLTATLIGNLGSSPDDEPQDGVVRMSWMNHERLAAELPQHDVLILPSFFDSFGMVVAEAMACGLPAIVTQNVGAKEMICSGENGLIIPAGDTAALAAAMRWFIENRKQLPVMSRAARHAAERYDWEHYHRRIADFFSGL